MPGADAGTSWTAALERLETKLTTRLDKSEEWSRLEHKSRADRIEQVRDEVGGKVDGLREDIGHVVQAVNRLTMAAAERRGAARLGQILIGLAGVPVIGGAIALAANWIHLGPSVTPPGHP